VYERAAARVYGGAGYGMSDNDVIHEFVRITSSRIRQSVDQFIRSTEGLPDDLRVAALEFLAAEAMITVRSMQEMADQLKGEGSGTERQ
jgi:hypothetical protein